MARSPGGPPPPSPSLKPIPTRQRAQTLCTTSPRTYHQPAGASQRGREAGRGLGGGTSGVPARGGGVGVFPGAGDGGGRKQAVFCDVVLEIQEGGLPQELHAFLDALGTPIEPSLTGLSSRPTMPSTPSKPPTVDIAKVRQSLHELWKTEESYRRKITSLRDHYAVPLRRFARSSATMIIPVFEATHLFANLEDLVPISEAFERDLRDLIAELDANPDELPRRFGEVILSNVQQMTPFRPYLASVRQAQAIYKRLVQSSQAFNDFIDRTQVVSRENTQATGGFHDFLSEPWQRAGRYRLMLDPMIRHLPATDENVEPLEEAVELLETICTMEVDEETRKASAMWSLRETIDGFPASLISSNRYFITCLDVDELVDSSTTLRCTLFLFSDKLVIAKRPSGEKTGRQHAGLDNLDNLAVLYSTSNFTSTQSSMLGSPKKLKKGVMGYRGTIELLELRAVDLGGTAFGLVLDRPPLDQSERWCGREARRFEVARTYAEDTRRAEKEVFLGRCAEASVLFRGGRGEGRAVRSGKVWENGGDEGCSVLYCWVTERRTWEGETRKGALVLHLDPMGEGSELQFGRGEANPHVVAKVNLLDQQHCQLSVRSQASSGREAETINLKRIIPAIIEISSSYGMNEFPTPRPTTPNSSRSRPKSPRFLSAALDVFGGGNLTRGHSNASKTSNTTTTTSVSRTSVSTGHGTPTPVSPSSGSKHLLSPGRSPAKLVKRTSPNWYGAQVGEVAAREDVRMARVEDNSASEYEDEEEEESMLRSRKPVGGSAQHPPPVRSHRRHSSLPPPPQPRFGSASPERVAVRAPHTQPRPSTMYDAFADAPDDVDVFGEANMTTSPIAYRPAAARRRPLGPRDMASRSPGPSTTPVAAFPPPSPVAALRPSPFASASSASSSASTSRIPVPAFEEDSPPPRIRPSDHLSINDANSHASTSTGKRPLVAASPRATPAKRVASVPESLPRGPSPNQSRGRIPSGGNSRIPSGAASVKRNRRVVSGASTIRASSPPPGSRSMDVDGPEYSLSLTVDLPPLERLQQHVGALRAKLARDVSSSSKENERIATAPAGLSRSPNTRNVFLKANGLPSTAVLLSEGRKNGNVDLVTILRWTDGLTDLVEACRSASSEGPTAPEHAKVVAERDALLDDLAAFKDAVKDMEASETRARRALSSKTTEKETLEIVYEDICKEVLAQREAFEADLDAAYDMMEEANPSVQLLRTANALRAETVEKNRAVVELSQLRREMALVRAENEERGRLLREHHLIP